MPVEAKELMFQYPSSRVILPDKPTQEELNAYRAGFKFQYLSSRVILPDFVSATLLGDAIDWFQYPSSRVILPDLTSQKSILRFMPMRLFGFNTPVVG